MSVVLSSQQAAVVNLPGDLLLLACPGSGKTRTAAARIDRLVRSGKRVAACSYTNVGADRIAAMLARDYDLGVEPRNFSGTVHRFLLTYVVLPFAHLAGARAPVHLWLGDWPAFSYQGDWRYPLALNQFRLDPTGALVFASMPRWVGKRGKEVLEAVTDNVLARKRGIFRSHGVISGDDAMWIALRLLREQPPVRAALAGRFDEILVDEAQDTSDLQLACLREISASGLQSLVMVGDLEQSIYSYQGASAKSCQALAADRGLTTIPLSQNYRSSQRLCDVAGHFSDRGPDKAVGPNRDCAIEPEIYVYPADDPSSVVTHFRGRLAAHGIDVQHSAILARDHKTIARLGGYEEEASVEPTPEAVGKIAAALAAGRLERHHVSEAEVLIGRGALDIHPTELDPEQREELNRAAHRMIGDLPLLTGDLRSWITGARAGYAKALERMTDEPKHKAGQMMRSSKKHADLDAAHVFARPASDLIAQTVHSLKGEDRAAVMVVVKRHSSGGRARQLQLLEATFGSGISEEELEERRVTYVALTRAERFCLLALPDDTKGETVATRCEGLGFRVTRHGEA